MESSGGPGVDEVIPFDEFWNYLSDFSRPFVSIRDYNIGSAFFNSPLVASYERMPGCYSVGMRSMSLYSVEHETLAIRYQRLFKRNKNVYLLTHLLIGILLEQAPKRTTEANRCTIKRTRKSITARARRSAGTILTNRGGKSSEEKKSNPIG